MTESKSITTVRALIINSQTELSRALVAELETLSITTKEVGEAELASVNFADYEYVVWNLNKTDNSSNIANRDYEKMMSPTAKYLFLLPAEVKDKLTEDLICQIHQLGPAHKVDLRVVTYGGVGDKAVAIKSIISFWFDRGHKGGTLSVKASSEFPQKKPIQNSIEIERYVAPVIREVVLPHERQPKANTRKSGILKKKTAFILGIIIAVVILIPIVIFKTLIYRANNINVASDSNTIMMYETGLEYLAKIVVPLNTKLTQSVYSATNHLARIRIQRDLANAVKRMITADQGNPFDSLRSARYGLDELYVFQATHPEVAGDRDWVVKTRQAVQLIPMLIAEDKKMTILVLLQNNLELRPTGGFIGAVALLTFDHGRLLTTDIRDIYDLDSNLKGIVSPPPTLKTYLGESSWFFRDANWSPDFPESAGISNWFLEKEWGSGADLIVGVNLNTIKEVLKYAGSITLPDGRVVGSDNLLVTAFNHQDIPSVKPDNKKQEFLSLFVKPLLDRSTQGTGEQATKILAALGSAIDHGEMTVVSTDKNTLAELTDLGWTGSRMVGACDRGLADPCSSDTFSLNETNIGVNKSNFYVSRSHQHQVKLSNTQAVHVHSVVYTNNSPGEAWPGGSYKSYVRMHLPLGATLNALSIDGNQLGEGAFTQTKTVKHELIETVMNVKPQGSLKMDIRYTTNLIENYQSYQWSMQKQPGTPADPIQVEVTPPPGKKISKGTPTISANFDKNQTVSLEIQ